MEANAVNTLMAHEMRSGVDTNNVRGTIESYTFATYGVVTKYANGRVDVRCGTLKFTNIEVIVFGINGWGIKSVPAVGDRVLLLSSQAPIIDLKTFAATGTMPAYDVSGLKAIPVCDDEKATQLITVDKSKIKITGDNKLTVDSQGVTFEDKNGNKVTTSSSGVAFEDKNSNKVTTDNSGIAIEDTNSNKITTSNSGFNITDKNGCKIVSSSTDIKINGKLQIKK
jgi:hypothetical protein